MKQILFVDDESHVLESFERMLRPERKNWKISTACGVAEALSEAARTDFDAIVSDYNMPGQDGFALLTEIRASVATADIPFVIVTGNSDATLKRSALELGATDLLSKPVLREDLIARLRSCLKIKEYQDAIKVHTLELERLVEDRTADLIASRHEIIWRLAKAAESRDEDTGNHVVRVACYARFIAEALEMSEDFVKLIFLSSPLHDIGKIGIPDNILLKPGKFDAAERDVMNTHTLLGGEILGRNLEMLMAINEWAPASLANTPMLCDNPILEMASEIALAHHEKWDGSGYPNGLRGDDIPIAARIVAVADVYDALCSKRPYKVPMPEDRALDIIEEGRGSHFDPAILDAFLLSLPKIRQVRLHFAEQDLAMVAA
jgi:putative two-component system response regulator